MEFFFSSLVFSRFRSSMCVCVCECTFLLILLLLFAKAEIALLCDSVICSDAFKCFPLCQVLWKLFANHPTQSTHFLSGSNGEQKKYLKFLFFARMLKIPKFYLFLRNQQNRQKREKFKFIPKEDSLLEPGRFCHGKRALLECWFRVSIVTFIHLSLSTNISRKDIYRLPFTWGAKEIQTNSIYAVKYYC